MTFVLQFLLAVLLFPWIVFFLSWFMTIGHWENEKYRAPALFLTMAIIGLALSIAAINIFSN